MGKSGMVSKLKAKVTITCPVCEIPLKCLFVNRTESQFSWALTPGSQQHLDEAHIKPETGEVFIKQYLSLVA